MRLYHLLLIAFHFSLPCPSRTTIYAFCLVKVFGNQDPQHNEDMFREQMKFGVVSKKIALSVLVSLSVLNLWQFA